MNTLNFPFKMGTTLIGTEGPAKLKGHCCYHINRHLLLLWMEFEHLSINQSLEYIFEDVATFGWVPEHKQ